ncbi:fimbrial protein [Stenotrophomonas sp. C2852]|uniref:fimbrial protein n=1 Tax=Stenotrophomonas sp. C2852 TaxID=3077845 RepID=UPI00293CEE61|nr:fimbrial protein [Stenotrophomonas sp. C2852]MDV3435166.1 fimbrial protein [Stenotrophomonas sp. C2852]
MPIAAVACTALMPPQSVDGTVEVANADPVGKRLGMIPWRGSAFGFSGCSGRQPIEIELAISGLTYVQDVQMDGLVFPAYATSATSPLLVFKHNSGYFGGATHEVPLALGRTVDPNSSRLGQDQYRSQVLVYVISRGGVMTSVPYTVLGTATTWPQNFPALQRVVPISIGINTRAPACRLSDASLTLDDVNADALARVGDSAGEKPIAVVMRCPGPGISVELSLSDANDPANVGSALQPTADSNAQGVRIELLRAGTPVRYGERWSHGVSTGGLEDIGFSARYLRGADAVLPGDINGEAVLTADYR